jgi:hypothetical protein
MRNINNGIRMGAFIIFGRINAPVLILAGRKQE